MIQSIYNFWQNWLGRLQYSGEIWPHIYDYMLHCLSWVTVGFCLFLAFAVIYNLVRFIWRLFV